MKAITGCCIIAAVGTSHVMTLGAGSLTILVRICGTLDYEFSRYFLYLEAMSDSTLILMYS